MVGVSELQQEVLHFSRIIDLSFIDEIIHGEREIKYSNKRIRSSLSVPEKIKIILELLTVILER